MTTAHDMQQELRPQVQMLREAIPTVFRAYADLHHAAITDGALPAILLNGGPATVWGPRALAAYLEYAQPEVPEQTT